MYVCFTPNKDNVIVCYVMNTELKNTNQVPSCCHIQRITKQYHP